MRDGAAPGPIRCAIYTRKSTEEGLEQEFNSLDAQREACAAYVLSQRHEGWTLSPDYYDDGGFSGGNLDRPGLKLLLADIAAGKIDVVVVYKVDRLTRSLADFSKIVDVLEKGNASFVSVTQAFNTTTSMGRLMLNVLLSFAQFEREVTAERIRDKVAASKKKGMWMGGPVPLGYRLEDRKLYPEPVEADTVRYIFRRYLELGSGRALVAELDGQGIRSKLRKTREGRAYGRQVISRGALYAILQNRLYVGEVTHRGESYPGQHEGIVDRALFEEVQRALAAGRIERRLGTNTINPSLLAGIIWDVHGRRMVATHSSRGGRRYRYYVSQTETEADRSRPVFRSSASDIEGVIIAKLTEQIRERHRARIADCGMDAVAVELAEAKALDTIEALAAAGVLARSKVLDLITRIEVAERELTIFADLASLDASAEPTVFTVSVEAVRSGKTLKLVLPQIGASEGPRINPSLGKLVAQAFRARDEAGRGGSFKDVAARLGYGVEYLADMLRTSYLSPRIIEAIVEGGEPRGLSRRKLVQTNRIPLCWRKQEELFGIG